MIADGIRRIGPLFAALFAFAIVGFPPTLAQAGDSGTGGADGAKPGTPKGNKDPGSASRSRTVQGGSRRARLPTLADGISFGPGVFGEMIAIGNKGIVTRFPGPDMTWRIGGRLHLDAGTAATNSPAVASSFQDALIRRAFIESYLTVADRLEVAFQYDTAPADLQPLQDAGVSYRVPGRLMLSVGNFKQPMGFDQLTSDNDTLFLERALLTALTPGRNFGGVVGVNEERWTVVAGIWGGDPNTGLATKGFSETARATIAPVLTAEQVLHLGFSESYRALDRNSRRFSFEATVASTPETNLLPIGNALVNTGTIAGASAIERTGFEAAYQFGSARLQGEAARETLARNARPDVTFSSFYAEAGWVLNGNRRPYRIKPSYGSEYAEFSGVPVEDGQRFSSGGSGVFEIAARVSAIDLSDRDIRGGSERNVTLGVNWYPERNVKLMGNYIHVDTTSSFSDRGHVEANILACRLQFYW